MLWCVTSTDAGVCALIQVVEKAVRELAVSTASVQLNRPVRSIHDLPDARQLLASYREQCIATGVAGCAVTCRAIVECWGSDCC